MLGASTFLYNNQAILFSFSYVPRLLPINFMCTFSWLAGRKGNRVMVDLIAAGMAPIVALFLILGINYLYRKFQASVPAETLVEYGSFVNIGGQEIHVWEEGAGKPVVMIHGFTGTTYDWRNNIKELSRRYAVFALDLPGFGYSAKPLDFEYSPEGFADFIVSYMDARGIGNAVLVGHSMGGLIAVATCLKHPERVSRLILVDPGGYGNPRFLPFRMMRLPIVGELLMSLNYRFVVEQSLKGVFYDSSLITPDVVDSYYNVYHTENARKTPPIVIRNLTKEPHLSAAVLTHVRCPALVIWGANDEVIPPSNAHYFERDLSDVKLMMVPEAGHLPHVEKADKVNQAMIEFISAGP